MSEDLELRMYFFVPYNISPIQQAIQAGHAALEYAHEFGETELFKDFVQNHKTWIILNGGTTRTGGIPEGTMQQIVGYINGFNIAANNQAQRIITSTFHEPDLNNALTAICFICDERVWDYENYPDFEEWTTGFEEYEDWVEFLGGPKNQFLRELLKDKKLA